MSRARKHKYNIYNTESEREIEMCVRVHTCIRCELKHDLSESIDVLPKPSFRASQFVVPVVVVVVVSAS